VDAHPLDLAPDGIKVHDGLVRPRLFDLPEDGREGATFAFEEPHKPLSSADGPLCVHDPPECSDVNEKRTDNKSPGLSKLGKLAQGWVDLVGRTARTDRIRTPTASVARIGPP
jgi:hypothetical protein